MIASSHRNALEQADISWSDGLPVSNRFNDVYYSRDDGLAESRHVFIEGNDLPARWTALRSGDRFTIIETGFGTGLNFLCAVQQWLATAPAGCRLDYLSVEKYPLPAEALAQALSCWPELADLTAELVASYPPSLPGVHRRWLFDDRVSLTLVFDDAVAGLNGLLASDHPGYRQRVSAVADAWFLDGFAPAKNPDLWSPALFELMACFSHTDTTLATFTVARAVRDGLGAAGFGLDKRSGFGRKREMLTGRFRGEKPAIPAQARPPSPGPLRNSAHQAPWYLNLNGAGSPRRDVAIIGAGIAGCTVAAALRRRGVAATLYDRHGVPGAEASGNPQGILYPKLSTEDSALALYGLHALSHALGFYPAYWRAGLPGEPCGVLVLPEDDRDQDRFVQLAERFREARNFVQLCTGGELRRTAGIELEVERGLFFPTLGWVSPPAVCRWLSDGLPLERAEIHQLAWCEKDARWRLLDDQGNNVATASQVVIASSHRAARYHQTADLPLRPVRGQITELPATPGSAALKTVLCGAGYLAPAAHGRHTLGATYDVDDSDSALRAVDHQRNLTTLRETDARLPALLDDPAPALTHLRGRAGVRCTTPDYLPLVGPVADAQAMAGRFADLARNARADIPLPGCYHRGLWISAGHGSRGLTYAPLAAELLAAQLCGEIPPLPRTLVAAVSPARFLIRQVKRRGGHAP